METRNGHGDTGRGWGRTIPVVDETLVRCGSGTPGGELLRRYWQPVALSVELGQRPMPLRIFGEDLVLFRDGQNAPGLLYARCSHRGTSLVYGKVEEAGLRCCYHGWMFDTQGRCVDTPCERGSSTRERVRQPWYPVVEHYGLVFAYLGPAEKQPEFPSFSLTEDLALDEEIVAFQRRSGPNSPHPKLAAKTDYNWWQAFDNFMDPFHVPVMHYMINGAQFVESLGVIPEVSFEYTPDGVKSIQLRQLPDGRLHQRISQVVMPNMHCTPGITDEDLGRSNLGWLVPQDDENYLHFVIARLKKGRSPLAFLESIGMMRDDWGPRHGRPFLEWSLEDHQQWQTDYTAQKGQGTITFHSEEHLGATDVGIGMMRRMFKKQSEAVATGANPVGSSPGTQYHVEIVAGNALLDPQTRECLAGFTGEAARNQDPIRKD